MIEKFMVLIIHELGPTGVLVTGLYLLMATPLKSMAHSLGVINHELGEVLKLMKEMQQTAKK